ncbi:protein serine/threonine phosphatase [Caldithrix abyssi DSM 13497]|uniref:Protein serine/threonine phosphatase n=1 Tax=Caldithrix abyssi DSM 13497 TaxID=880073 RepID=H1XQ89_CALAY|nr:two-component regulator propeller domain-containing protein [Caldithrix abyssi]APF19508.1 Serine phosphatase RsbU, regulator of sigma subunit [Caldithrix abyssi DSM 13497]EHO43394.1 protein serine/threonine phosphatase [Caldithrix abyssi DSM 13497]
MIGTMLKTSQYEFVKGLVFLGLLLLICSTNRLTAQHRPVKFEHLSSSDGLSQNKVFDITQDHQGFIWIATEDGLNRYDGFNFKIFKNIPGNSSSLFYNGINCVYVSKDGLLWTGGQNGGLGRFDAQSETFVNFLHDAQNPGAIAENFVVSISEDERGNLWIATKNNGFNYFKRSTRQFIHSRELITTDSAIFPLKIDFIYQDAQNWLWVGAQNTVFVFEIAYTVLGTPRLRPIRLKHNLKSSAISIAEDKKSNIWIGTRADGLLHFQRGSHVLRSYGSADLKQTLSASPILSIAADANGALWLGGMFPLGKGNIVTQEGTGLLKVDLRTHTIQKYVNRHADRHSLSSNNILSLFIDRTGVLWVGTYLRGVNKYDISGIKFKLFKSYEDGQNIGTTRGLYLDGNHKLWIGTADGLTSYDQRSGRFERFKHDSTDTTTISSDVVRCIYDDGQYLWIGTLRGLNRFDLQSGTFRRFYLDPVHLENPINSVTYNIIQTELSSDYLWFGSSGGGLVRFHKKTFEFKNFVFDARPGSRQLSGRDNLVRTVWQSKSRPDEIWAGTTQGINILNIKSGKFRYYMYDVNDSTSLSHQSIMQFYEDTQGYIWVATYGGGLNRFNPRMEQFLRFTEENSALPNNVVYGMLPDDDGNLWLSTNKGISKFNRSNFSFRNYTVDDGLQSEEFNGGSHHRGRNGELFFGGIKGFNSFFPAEIRDNSFLPALVVTELKIFDKLSMAGEKAPRYALLSGLKQARLAYWQNDLSFEFVALHFANPAKNQYAFKLENYDHKWRYVGNTRTASYTNLDPGRYVFRVKAANNDGVWNEAGKAIHLIIAPPWWQTNWSYAFYLLAFVLGVFLVDRFQRRRLIARERSKIELAVLEAENRRKSMELEEARSLQQAMLPREIPRLPGLEIAVFMQTASEVGGDYYDFYLCSDGALTIVLGDATGHGMRAGTMVTVAKSLFNSHASNPDIMKPFREITRCIKQMHMEKMAMCLTILKIRNNHLQAAVAGMPPIFVYRQKSGLIEEFLVQAMPLGTMEQFPYQTREIALEVGDTILLMSDGLPELRDSVNRMYGYERIKNDFYEVAENTSQDIIDFFREKSSHWKNKERPDDDVTIMAIKIKTDHRQGVMQTMPTGKH